MASPNKVPEKKLAIEKVYVKLRELSESLEDGSSGTAKRLHRELEELHPHVRQTSIRQNQLIETNEKLGLENATLTAELLSSRRMVNTLARMAAANEYDKRCWMAAFVALGVLAVGLAIADYYGWLGL